MPSSTFAADGTMLHGSLKSTFMDVFEKLDIGEKWKVTLKRICMPVRIGVRAYTESHYCRFNGWRLQALEKLDWIKNCCHVPG